MLLSPARFKLVACGRRWGKTSAAMLAAIAGHGPTPHALRGALAGGNIWWVAPSYPQIVASNIWRNLKKALQGCWDEKNEVEKTILLPGGGSISVRSADNEDSLRGPGLDGVVLDEAAFISRTAWTEAIRPALADKGGWAMMITTPNGHNWFHDLWRLGSTQAGYQAWQRPSSDNPLVTQDELDAIRLEIGERAYAQEHLAQFTSMEGAEWPAEYFQTIWADYWPAKFDLSVIAVDPSKGRSEHSDYSAIVFAGLHQGKIWVDADLARRPVGQICHDVIRMHDKLPTQEVFIEGNANQDLLFSKELNQQTTDKGMYPLPIVTQENREKKEKRIYRLGPYIKGGLIKLRHGSRGCEILERQLRGFPLPGEHDDGPDALAMALERLRLMARNRMGSGTPNRLEV